MYNFEEILSDKRQTDEFIKNNTKLVHKVIRKTYPSLISTYDYEDYVQEGMLGLHRAMKTYNMSRGDFGKYAYICIKSDVLKRLKVQKNKPKMYDKNVVSIFENYDKTDLEENTYEDILQDENAEFESHVDDTELGKHLIEKLRQRLNPNRLEVFELMLQDYNQAEIARKKGLSRERIRQIEDKIKQEARKIVI